MCVNIKTTVCNYTILLLSKLFNLSHNLFGHESRFIVNGIILFVRWAYCTERCSVL